MLCFILGVYAVISAWSVELCRKHILTHIHAFMTNKRSQYIINLSEFDNSVDVIREVSLDSEAVLHT